VSEADAGRGGAPLATIARALRRERTRAGLSLAELARRAGIAKSTVSQLEAGSGNPSVETLWALSVVLEVPFSRLVEEPSATVRVIRAGEGPTVYSERSSYLATLLSSCPPGARRDLYLISAEPGEPRISAPHAPGVVEHVVVSHGRVLAGLVDDPVELGPGDYLSYPGDVEHVYRALRAGSRAVLLSEHR
jgi:transcriptional regulator with XRE-family HTH domain